MITQNEHIAFAEAQRRKLGRSPVGGGKIILPEKGIIDENHPLFDPNGLAGERDDALDQQSGRTRRVLEDDDVAPAKISIAWCDVLDEELFSVDQQGLHTHPANLKALHGRAQGGERHAEGDREISGKVSGVAPRLEDVHEPRH